MTPRGNIGLKGPSGLTKPGSSSNLNRSLGGFNKSLKSGDPTPINDASKRDSNAPKGLRRGSTFTEEPQPKKIIPNT